MAKVGREGPVLWTLVRGAAQHPIYWARPGSVEQCRHALLDAVGNVERQGWNHIKALRRIVAPIAKMDAWRCLFLMDDRSGPVSRLSPSAGFDPSPRIVSVGRDGRLCPLPVIGIDISNRPL
jgi:hypothetical protein